MDTFTTHYARHMGLDDFWRANAFDLRLDEPRVEIRLTQVGPGVSCPECGRSGGLADQVDERRWRHLDTMQFTTELVARLPRCRCTDHGVTTIVPPWAGKHSRFTLFNKPLPSKSGWRGAWSKPPLPYSASPGTRLKQT